MKFVSGLSIKSKKNIELFCFTTFYYALCLLIYIDYLRTNYGLIPTVHVSLHWVYSYNLLHILSLFSLGFTVALAGSLDRCPSSFNRLGEYKTADGETCYAFVNTEKTWVDARQHCWGWGGELIMIKDQAKMNFVIHTLNSVLRWRNNGVWIGAHDRKGRGWEWTNGRLTSEVCHLQCKKSKFFTMY